MWPLALLVLLPACGAYQQLVNITEAVFGRTLANRSFLPAAFGDFNSDKLTDLVVLRDGQKTVQVWLLLLPLVTRCSNLLFFLIILYNFLAQVLLATEQEVVSSGEDPPLFLARGDLSLECNAPQGSIVSAVPAGTAPHREYHFIFIQILTVTVGWT